LFVGIIIIVLAILKLPTSYCATFVIEEKFGFNKTTKKLFVQDAVKELIIMLALGLLWFLDLPGYIKNFSLNSGFMVDRYFAFMFIFGSRIFLPMFNKLKPTS
jgi:STE24 endopeptidase